MDSKAWLLPRQTSTTSDDSSAGGGEPLHGEAARAGAAQARRLLRGLVPALTVCAYAGCPLAVSWAKVVGFEPAAQGLVPIKGRPFKDASVVVASWALVALTGLALSAFLGGASAVRRCFDLRAAVRIAPAGAGWALADICEVLAVSRIDPPTYGVISQARLLACATACRVLRGMRQTRVQWGILLSLSLVCAIYCISPDDGRSSRNYERLFRWRMSRAEVKLNWYYQEPQRVGATSGGLGDSYLSGVALALSKVALSVLSGVYGECCFKDHGAVPSPAAVSSELHIQMTQAAMSSLVAAYCGYLFICWSQGEDPDDFLGGPDGAWDARTCLLAAMLCFREWICNLCVKQFDSLVKNICNAIALVVTYGLAVGVFGDSTFSLLKAMLLLAVVVEVLKYAATRRDEPGRVGGGGCPAAIPWEQASCRRASYQDDGGIPVAEYAAVLASAHCGVEQAGP